MYERAQVIEKKSDTNKRSSAPKVQNTEFSPSTSTPADRILSLQRSVGNQAIQRLIESGAIQAKLKIGQPNDMYEQEADQVAEQVLKMPLPDIQPKPTGPFANVPSCGEEESIQTKRSPIKITPLVRRQSEEEEEEEAIQEELEPSLLQKQVEPEEEEEIQTKSITENIMRMPSSGWSSCAEEKEEQLQTKPITTQITPLVRRQSEEDKVEEEEEEAIQTKGNSSNTAAVTPGIESSINSLKGGGQPLPESVRSYFEPQFGTSFNQVRVHNNSQAANIAKSINAKAFTTGKDVVFGAGQYSPETDSGKRLLAHELTHVVQQESDLQNIPFSVVQRDIYDLLNTSITPEYARALSDDELEEQVQFLRDEMRSNPDPALSSNLEILEAEAFRRIPSVEIISADVTSDLMSVRLEPSDRCNDFTLELLGPEGSHVIRREVRSGGTHSETFDIPRLRQGEYDNIRATWGGTAYNDTYPYQIHVLGVYRHSQYNIPHENTCAGPAVNVYITDNACAFTPAVLIQQFVNQVNLNGSGVSIAHGNLRREAFCLRRRGAPADARDRSFRQVAAFHGSCNGNTGTLDNSTVARRPGHPHLTCDDRVYIHTVGTKTVTDLCPGCVQAHLDNFTTVPACAGIRDLGNFMTIKLF